MKWWTIVGLFALIASCSQPDSPKADACPGAGEELVADGEELCVYDTRQSNIIETGFQCPPDRRTRTDFGDLIVCSDGAPPMGTEDDLLDAYPAANLDSERACGDGEQLQTEGACLFTAEMTDEAFACPDAVPVQRDLNEGGAVCTEDDELPTRLVEELTARGLTTAQKYEFCSWRDFERTGDFTTDLIGDWIVLIYEIDFGRHVLLSFGDDGTYRELRFATSGCELEATCFAAGPPDLCAATGTLGTWTAEGDVLQLSEREFEWEFNVRADDGSLFFTAPDLSIRFRAATCEDQCFEPL